MINTTFSDMARQQLDHQSKQSYMDLNSLHSIRQTGSKDKELGLLQVAQQFESMFIKMVLKSMREAGDVFAKDNPLNTSESKHYRDMYDNQLSLSLSGKGVGIADALYRQLKSQYLANTNDSSNSKLNQDNMNHYFDNAHHQNNPYIPQRIKDAKLLNNVNGPEDFIKAMTPYAKKTAAQMGVDYKVLVAQAALETGWGEHIIRDKNGNQSFNLFNIKADKRWHGQSISVPTTEYVNGVAQREQADFRRYRSIEDSFTDYQTFLNQPRYKKALEVAGNPELFVKKLQEAGYATDPHYSEKINRILNSEFIH